MMEIAVYIVDCFTMWFELSFEFSMWFDCRFAFPYIPERAERSRVPAGHVRRFLKG